MESILNTIASPEDIKKLSHKELSILSDEIREFLISNLSKTGGHLASNLGIVEVTLALHYIFDSPKDKIIWDVGHQSYVHKIITGRKEGFSSIRSYGGLSGFPKRSESAHDVFETGHSSTSISAALGMARARDLKGESYSVVSVIGDGALTGGMAFEALNDAGHSGNKIIVVLNDNEMSISQNVGAMSSYLSKIRTNPKYTRAKKEIEELIRRIPSVGKGIAYTVEKIKNSFKYLLVPGIFFEEIGFTYLGPVDGHNISKLLEVLQQAEKSTGPVFLHVMTQKGKGYSFAEKDPEKFHGISPFTVETGQVIQKKSYSYSKSFGTYLTEMALKDKRIAAVTAAMPEGTGLLRFRSKFPERFFDVGIAEQHGVTMAAGLASSGMIPFFAVYSTFLQRAYDQILHDVCLPKLPVILAIDRAGLVGPDGETHQGVFDLSYLRHMPNITIMAPKDINELKGMMDLALSLGVPVAIRYPKGGTLLHGVHSNLPIRFKEWEILIPKGIGVILAVGRMVETALLTAKLLESEGIPMGVINARFIKPMDEEMLSMILKTYPFIFTMEDNVLAGGFGSGIMEYMNMHYCITENSMPRIFSFGIPDHFVTHGSVQLLFDELDLSPNKLAQQIKKILDWEKKPIGRTSISGI